MTIQKRGSSESDIDGENLVKFPAARSFSKSELGPDPLKELLEEFAYAEEELEPLEDHSHGNDFGSSLSVASASSFIDPKQFKELAAPEMREYILGQLSLLDDARKRIDYLLYEIDTYLPKKY